MIFSLFQSAIENDGQRILDSFMAMCSELGVPLAPEKTMGPSTCITYLGLEIDSQQQLVKVPAEKVKALVSLLKQAKKCSSMSLRSIQSLLGSLNFVCRAISPGRAFMRRLIALTTGAHPSSQISIGKGAKQDIDMWLTFLEAFNGSTLFLDMDWITSPS